MGDITQPARCRWAFCLEQSVKSYCSDGGQRR